MKNILGAIILGAAFAATAQPKKMSGELFAKIAADWYLTDQCTFEGRIKPETAAYGKQLLRQSLDNHEEDMARFEQLVEALRKKQNKRLPDPRVCNTLAMQIEEIRLEVANAEAKVRGRQ